MLRIQTTYSNIQKNISSDISSSWRWWFLDAGCSRLINPILQNKRGPWSHTSLLLYATGGHRKSHSSISNHNLAGAFFPCYLHKKIGLSGDSIEVQKGETVVARRLLLDYPILLGPSPTPPPSLLSSVPLPWSVYQYLTLDQKILPLSSIPLQLKVVPTFKRAHPISSLKYCLSSSSKRSSLASFIQRTR